MSLLASLLDIDGALEAQGVPPMSSWWREQARRFYEHPTALQLVAMVGRGGDKTRTSVKMGLAETLGGDFKIPVGETHYLTHVAENVTEATKTLGVYENYLRILGVSFRRAGDTIELVGEQRGIKVLASRVGAVSGWRSFGFTGDELAKWSNEGADPSAEVIASIRAMTVTHPTARGRLISSPMARTGYFFDTWNEGDTDTQVTAHAPTWVANPTVTEAHTHKLEPHAATHAREYGAIPSSSSSVAMSAEDVEVLARELAPNARPMGQPLLVIDSSSGRGDGWSYALARYFAEGEHRRLYVWHLGAFEGRFGLSTPFDAVVTYCARVAKVAGVRVVIGDQHNAFALVSAFGRHGMTYQERTWTQTTKVEATSTLRRMMREKTLVVEPGDQAEKLKRELLMLEEKILPSGAITVTARRSGAGHADRASLLLMLAHAEAEGDISGSATHAQGPASFATARTAFAGGVDMVSPQTSSAFNRIEAPRPAVGLVGGRGGAATGPRLIRRGGGW